MIYSYRKIIDRDTTRALRLPEDPTTRQTVGQEIADVDGVTFVVIPDAAILPREQPPGIEPVQVTLTVSLLGALKAASPNVRVIDQRVRDRIREGYTVEDEIQLLRTAPSAEFEVYNAYVEDCLGWGREEKQKLGL